MFGAIINALNKDLKTELRLVITNITYIHIIKQYSVKQC